METFGFVCLLAIGVMLVLAASVALIAHYGLSGHVKGIFLPMAILIAFGAWMIWTAYTNSPISIVYTGG